MLSLGGLMKHIFGAWTAFQAINMARKTDMISNIINIAASNAERVADLLEKAVEGLEEEE